MTDTIPAHGGNLINRLADAATQSKLKAMAAQLPSITLPAREQCDVVMIACGAFSPLTGFMGKADFDSVCQSMHLANGTVWPIPITCSVSTGVADTIARGQQVALRNEFNDLMAVMTVEDKYAHDKASEAERVYRTTASAHPGVAVVQAQGDVCLGGPITVLPQAQDPEFQEFNLSPQQTRAYFAQRGWKTIAAFQTRNPIHRAHEYLTKCALEICDGLLIHPLVGETQAGDIPADVRMRCYQVLIENYYVRDRTLLAVMPAAMRYAGPREAILHAIVRQNYGCTHFIVGRDHAGVGNYYGTYDAQLIFDEFAPGELAITPLKFEHSSWCKKCESMTSSKTCPHPAEDKVALSGTKVREMLAAGQKPPLEFSRPEVADVLIESMQAVSK